MNQGKFILVNGFFHPSDEYRISLTESKALLFTEKIRAVRTAFPFFAETFELIKLKLLIFNQSFPEFTDRNGAGLKRQLERTLTKNKLFMGAQLSISFSLINQLVQYRIESEKLDEISFQLNEKGLYLGLFNKIQKPSSALSNLSLGSSVYWDIAKNHLANSTVDQLVMVDTKDHILEVPEANLYLIRGNNIRSTSSEQGAFMDITQALMHDIFNRLHFNYSEAEDMTGDDIRASEEVMIVNATEGIRWIVGFEDKRFFNTTIKKISELFNQLVVN